MFRISTCCSFCFLFSVFLASSFFLARCVFDFSRYHSRIYAYFSKQFVLTNDAYVHNTSTFLFPRFHLLACKLSHTFFIFFYSLFK